MLEGINASDNMKDIGIAEQSNAVPLAEQGNAVPLRRIEANESIGLAEIAAE